MTVANIVQLVELSSIRWFQRYWLRTSLRRSNIFVRTCRAYVQTAQGVRLFRLTYLSTCSDYSKAEAAAESFVARVREQDFFGSEHVIEMQWKRGRMVTQQTLASEDATIVMALYRLLKHRLSEQLIYDTVDEVRVKSKRDQATAASGAA